MTAVLAVANHMSADGKPSVAAVATSINASRSSHFASQIRHVLARAQKRRVHRQSPPGQPGSAIVAGGVSTRVKTPTDAP
jgi:hypothetical protein